MTQEEKKLLLKDICARLPYGTYVHHKNCPDTKFKIIAVFNDGRIGVTENEIPLTPTSINECKPYLRSMSSMTEEEKKVVCSMNMISDTELNDRLNYQRMYMQNYTIETFDYFNEHYFDYHGLIEKGLALEAPEGMYK